jgi:hypothetical protein
MTYLSTKNKEGQGVLINLAFVSMLIEAEDGCTEVYYGGTAIYEAIPIGIEEMRQLMRYAGNIILRK